MWGNNIGLGRENARALSMQEQNPDFRSICNQMSAFFEMSSGFSVRTLQKKIWRSPTARSGPPLDKTLEEAPPKHGRQIGRLEILRLHKMAARKTIMEVGGRLSYNPDLRRWCILCNLSNDYP
jgi:hypothetical protein